MLVGSSYTGHHMKPHPMVAVDDPVRVDPAVVGTVIPAARAVVDHDVDTTVSVKVGIVEITTSSSAADAMGFVVDFEKRAFSRVAKQVWPRPWRLVVVAAIDRTEIDPAVVVVDDGCAGGKADVAALVGRDGN